METIINQITASQGLSAVAVLALFNLLFVIIYAFFIGKAFDRIKEIQVSNYVEGIRVDNLSKLFSENQEQLELLKKSHSELNLTFLRDMNSTSEHIVENFNERDKRVAELEKQILKAIEVGNKRQQSTNLRIEATNRRISKIKVAEAKKELAETLEKKTKQPKFKAGDKVKTNTGSFKGVVVDRIFENKKFLFLVSNKSNGSQRWFSETTLRFQ